ncbi:MAG: PepSY domain-containing protein [Gammaproteobacteria bacterium]|nr:PepSY domain-containing protein [Gammaproteobacteria bacterium]
MSVKPSAALVKSSLSSHSWLGLSVALLMYLVCLSGTLVVYFEEFERWEQPNIPEYLDYSPDLIGQAVNNFSQRVTTLPERLYVVLPTQAVPRMHVSDGAHEWFVNQDGSLSEAPVEGWTYFLKELHINLHLPKMLGLILVGILGVMLCALIISGLVAHPRIFKDAFKVRLGVNKAKEQADLHNRLSVWGTPFYFMIGLSGAFIGLVSIIIAVGSFALYGNDREKMVDIVYGSDPVITTAATPLDFKNTLASLAKVAPDAQPIYFLVHNLNKKGQFIEVAATLPQRLIYSEMYRFKSDGTFINQQGLSNGNAGRQIAYSVYRIHFGHFGGFAVKIFYGLMGLALTVISVTGINIWLAKRKHRSYLNDVWVACVWGTPLALSGAASAALFGLSAPLSFLVILLSCISGCVLTKNEHASRQTLLASLGLSLLVIVGGYALIHGIIDQHPVAFALNIILTISGLGLLLMAYLRYKQNLGIILTPKIASL